MTGCAEVYSSVGGAVFLKRLVLEWRQAGWQVDCVHAMREHEYRSKSGLLMRLVRRWRMYGGFSLTCWRQARKGRAAGPVRIVTTNPFFAPALVQWSAKGRGATINLVYDLFPDALVHAGVMRRDSPIAQACALLTRRAFHECDATVFLGQRLRRHAELAYGPARRAVVIPVGADGSLFRNQPLMPSSSAAPVTVLYAGQMGRMHETDALLNVVTNGLLPAGVRLRFHSSGTGYSRLRSAAKPGLCEWGGPLHDDEWQQMMGDAQVALVTMTDGAQQVVMPSKTYSAMVAGQAILAVCPMDSDLADLVFEHDCGWVVSPGDSAGLVCLFERLLMNPEELMNKRRNAYRAGHERFDMAPVAKRWLELIREYKVEAR